MKKGASRGTLASKRFSLIARLPSSKTSSGSNLTSLADGRELEAGFGFVGGVAAVNKKENENNQPTPDEAFIFDLEQTKYEGRFIQRIHLGLRSPRQEKSTVMVLNLVG